MGNMSANQCLSTNSSPPIASWYDTHTHSQIPIVKVQRNLLLLYAGRRWLVIVITVYRNTVM